jgi:hypothetical protein
VRGKSTLIEHNLQGGGPREGGGYIYENNISNSIMMARSAVYANNGKKSILCLSAKKQKIKKFTIKK